MKRQWLAVAADAAFLVASLFVLYTLFGGEVPWKTAFFRITLTEPTLGGTGEGPRSGLISTPLYLLRNLSKGRGVGFFEAGNFHPDFILWLLAGGQQHVIFVDPKGIRNLGPSDPKIHFHEAIREIELRLGDANVHLQSFIVSNTASHTMQMLWSMEKTEMRKRHILFQEEDKDSYVQSMLGEVGAEGATPYAERAVSAAVFLPNWLFLPYGKNMGLVHDVNLPGHGHGQPGSGRAHPGPGSVANGPTALPITDGYAKCNLLRSIARTGASAADPQHRRLPV